MKKIILILILAAVAFFGYKYYYQKLNPETDFVVSAVAEATQPTQNTLDARTPKSTTQQRKVEIKLTPTGDIKPMQKINMVGSFQGIVDGMYVWTMDGARVGSGVITPTTRVTLRGSFNKLINSTVKHIVRLTITPKNGTPISAMKTITVVPANSDPEIATRPTVYCSTSPYPAYYGQAVTFKAEVQDADGLNVKYKWDTGAKENTLVESGLPYGVTEHTVQIISPLNGLVLDEYTCNVNVTTPPSGSGSDSDSGSGSGSDSDSGSGSGS